MNSSEICIILSLAVLAIVAIAVFFKKKNKKEQTLSPLAGLAFAFILAGLIFGDNRLIAYSLLGIGIILAIIDIVKKAKKK